jgi:hypothetical protein
VRRIIATAAVLCLAFGGVALAGSSDARRRSPSGRANPQPLPGAHASGEEARQAARAALRDQLPRVAWTGACQTLRCINVPLNKLKTAANNAQAHVNALDDCLGIQGMTSYGEDPNGGTFGYVWRDDTVPEEFLTTSLDYDTLELADIWAVVWLC